MPAQYKVDQVAELKELFNGAEAFFVAEYRGLTVAQVSALRKAIREAGGKARVARNRLALIALSEDGLGHNPDMMKGPNLYIVASTNSPAVAKAITKFAEDKANAAFVIKGGFMGQNELTLDNIKALASMPSREELLAKAVGSIVSPLRGLVTVLSGLPRGLVTALSAIADKKKEAA
ncbi:MAG: 50S ribosomal protein L10 [Pyramidobacter sp.]